MPELHSSVRFLQESCSKTTVNVLYHYEIWTVPEADAASEISGSLDALIPAAVRSRLGIPAEGCSAEGFCNVMSAVPDRVDDDIEGCTETLVYPTFIEPYDGELTCTPARGHAMVKFDSCKLSSSVAATKIEEELRLAMAEDALLPEGASGVVKKVVYVDRSAEAEAEAEPEPKAKPEPKPKAEPEPKPKAEPDLQVSSSNRGATAQSVAQPAGGGLSLSLWAIIGIVLGSLALIALIVLLVRRRRKKDDEGETREIDGAAGPADVQSPEMDEVDRIIASVDKKAAVAASDGGSGGGPPSEDGSDSGKSNANDDTFVSEGGSDVRGPADEWQLKDVPLTNRDRSKSGAGSPRTSGGVSEDRFADGTKSQGRQRSFGSGKLWGMMKLRKKESKVLSSLCLSTSNDEGDNENFEMTIA